MATRNKYRPKGIKLDVSAASQIDQARFQVQFSEAVRRLALETTAKKFASDLHANPSMRFEDLEGRVRELSRYLTVEVDGRKIASATEQTASPDCLSSAKPRPAGRKPKSAYAEAYAIRDQTGSWKKVWQSLSDKFPTTESRTKVREAYKTRNRRREGTKPASSR